MSKNKNLIKLTENLFLVLGKNQGKFPYVNCFFINDKKRAIIDPGKGHLPFLKNLKKLNLIIINSHFHPEHNTYNNYLDKKVLIHLKDKNALTSLNNFQKYYGDMDKKLFRIWKKWTTQFLGFAPLKKITNLKEKEISFGKTTLKIISTPGHTPGHICFYLPQEKILLSTDIDLTLFGPWYGHKCSSINDFISSIEKLKKMKIKLLIPSHGPPIKENILERLNNYQNIIFKREKSIKSFYQNSGDDFAFTKGLKMLYGKEIPKPKTIWEFFGKVMIAKHLERIKNKIC